MPEKFRSGQSVYRAGYLESPVALVRDWGVNKPIRARSVQEVDTSIDQITIAGKYTVNTCRALLTLRVRMLFSFDAWALGQP